MFLKPGPELRAFTNCGQMSAVLKETYGMFVRVLGKCVVVRPTLERAKHLLDKRLRISLHIGNNVERANLECDPLQRVNFQTFCILR